MSRERGRVCGPDGRKHRLVNNRGPWVDKDKAETFRLTGSDIYWGDKAPRGRQKKCEEAGISRVGMEPFAHYALITIKLA